MNKIILTLVSFVFLLNIGTVEAQTLSKSEKKALKKIIKTYKKDPEKWARMQTRHTNEVLELNDSISSLRSRLAREQAARKELLLAKKELQEKLSYLENRFTSGKGGGSALPMGNVYQVQMGYFEYLDLMSFNENMKTVKAEEVDGAKRYVIGHFFDVSEAIQFSNDIKALGIKDAFVSEYIDGVRNMEFDALKQ